MTNEKIIEGNMVIAQYMGMVRKENEHFHLWVNKIEAAIGKAMPTDFDKLLMEFKYHSSWNWLMPVVEKIEEGNFGFKMCRKVVEIYFDDSKDEILKVKLSSRLESLYNAVVDFINWYNKQK